MSEKRIINGAEYNGKKTFKTGVNIYTDAKQKEIILLFDCLDRPVSIRGDKSSKLYSRIYPLLKEALFEQAGIELKD